MDRWNKIEGLIQEALERPPAEREAWLRQACGEDSDLRQEVVSLVANYREDIHEDPWVATAAVELIGGPGSLVVGQHLGPFTILEPIGAGGMGEVYRARDTRLQRDVAMKVLPRALADDEER